VTEKVSNVISAVTYSASGSTFLFGAFSAHDVAVIGGLVIASLTFLVNWIYKHKIYKLQVAEMSRRHDD